MRCLIIIVFLFFSIGCKSEMENKPNLLMNIDEIYTAKEEYSLAKAAGNGDITKVNALVKDGANVNGVGNKKLPVLFWPLREQNIKGFEELLKLGANPNHQWETGNSIMELVSGIADSNYLKLVLKYSGNPNLVNPKGKKTPLFSSVRSGAMQNIRLLVKGGADLNALDGGDESAIFNAVGLGDYKIALELIRLGARYDIVNRWGHTIKYSMDGRIDTPEKGDEQYEYYQELVDIISNDTIITH